jgi:hypothetical protein
MMDRATDCGATGGTVLRFAVAAPGRLLVSHAAMAVTAITHDPRVLESAMHAWCIAWSNTVCESGYCRSCPGAPVGQRFHVGRRGGDAVWHRRSDLRIPPSGNRRQAQSSRMSSRTCGAGQLADAPPSRKSRVRELRADAVKVRRPRTSGVGAKRRTLHSVEHSSTLTNVTAGQCAPCQKVAQF